MIVLVLLLCAGSWGCALKRQPLPQSPTDEVRAQLKTVGLAAAGLDPQTQVNAPTSGKGMGAVKGAGYGLALGVTPGLAIAGGVAKGCHASGRLGAVVCGAALAFGLGVAAAGGTVGALGGSVYGAVTAEPASRVDAAETGLKSAVSQANIQAALRDHVLEAVRRRSALNFVTVDDQGPSAVGERIDYRALAGEGIDTILEVSVLRIALVGQGGINPPVSLFMAAGASLVRTADGVEIYAEKFEYRGPGALFLEWAAADAQMFRQEVDRGTRSLAEKIVRLLFPAEPPRESAPAEHSAEPPTAPAAPQPVAAATASSDPRSPTVEAAATESSQRARVDPQRLAVLGTWLGTLRPAEASRTYPASLRIFEESGQLRWELTRRREDRELAGSGDVSVAEATLTLTGTDVTYSLRRVGASLVGTGLGADNRAETLFLMRALGQ
ncbi:MAG: hypothetical protein DMF83_23355 [Acidobacteria bacterium]|nr:MAG: hypothetical protein DMF83_23355 [Acidobacteriota bacterium]